MSRNFDMHTHARKFWDKITSWVRVKFELTEFRNLKKKSKNNTENGAY